MHVGPYCTFQYLFFFLLLLPPQSISITIFFPPSSPFKNPTQQCLEANSYSESKNLLAVGCVTDHQLVTTLLAERTICEDKLRLRQTKMTSFCYRFKLRVPHPKEGRKLLSFKLAVPFKSRRLSGGRFGYSAMEGKAWFFVLQSKYKIQNCNKFPLSFWVKFPAYACPKL